MTKLQEPLTRDLVARTALDLQGEGRRASWREVRKRLGRGSPNTILGFLREIEAEHRNRKAVAEPAPPAAITDLVGSKVWQAALAAARELVAAERRDLEARLQAEEARCSDLAGLVERLEEQVIEARRQADGQIEVLRTLAQGQERMLAALAESREQALEEGRMAAARDLAQQDRDAGLAMAVAATQAADAALRESLGEMQAAQSAALDSLGRAVEGRLAALGTAQADAFVQVEQGRQRDLEAASERLAAAGRSQMEGLTAALAVLREDIAAARAAQLAAVERAARAEAEAERGRADLQRAAVAAAEREQAWRARWDEQRTDIQRGWNGLREALAAAVAPGPPEGRPDAPRPPSP